MNITIREIDPKDYKKAIQFAITGMHFGIYLDNKFILKLYGNYFWYSELNEATQVLAAYNGDRFCGVLLANMYGEKKKYRSFGKTLFTSAVNIFQNVLYGGGAGVYEKTNEEMYAEYRKSHSPHGQMVFLAADPEAGVKGIGSLLLDELEKREPGKEIFLYTDDACTYQFYEHRGFECAQERGVVLEFGEKKVPLRCMIYRKRL